MHPNWTRIASDINGNSRFVTSWLGYGFKSYDDAIRAANKIGGRKYHTKKFGGGLVFQAYESELPGLNAELMDMAHGNVRNNPSHGEADHIAADELRLFIINDADLYRQQFLPIVENIKRKLKSGKYDHSKAPKLWGYLVESGAKKYNKEFGDGTLSLKMFDKATRDHVAQEMADENLPRIQRGEFDTARKNPANPIRPSHKAKNPASRPIKLETILKRDYAVTVQNAPPYALIWSADTLGKKFGKEYAAAELSRVNALREKTGRVPAYPGYESGMLKSRKNPAKQKVTPKYHIVQQEQKGLWYSVANFYWKNPAMEYAKALHAKTPAHSVRVIHGYPNTTHPAI